MSPARRAINILLALHPELEVESIDSQQPNRSDAIGGPWVLVNFVAHARPYAIWKATGAIFQLDPLCAVEDAPLVVSLEGTAGGPEGWSLVRSAVDVEHQAALADELERLVPLHRADG